MKTIKAIAVKIDSTIYGTHNASVEETSKILADNKTYEMLHDDGIVFANWWYFHGDLQAKIGYDGGFIMNYGELSIVEKKKMPYNSNTEITYISIEDGVYKVKVHGIDENCIGYFWNADFGLRGLVCLESDYDSRQDAMNKLIEKPEIL